MQDQDFIAQIGRHYVVGEWCRQARLYGTRVGGNAAGLGDQPVQSGQNLAWAAGTHDGNRYRFGSVRMPTLTDSK